MQIKTREATSNDPCGPTTHSMNEIASATYDDRKFREVMSILRRRLNDHGKNWRHVYKSLLIIEYCIQFGSERMTEFALCNIQLIKTLKEFQFIDSEARDHGASVRQKSRELTALLMDMEQQQGSHRRGRRLASSHSAGSQNAGFKEDEVMRAAMEESNRYPQTHVATMESHRQQQTQIATAAPLIDLLSEEPEETSALSYTDQLHNNFWTPNQNQPFEQGRLQGNTGFNQRPPGMTPQPQAIANQFNDGFALQLFTNSGGPFQEGNNSISDSNHFSLYTRPEANHSGILNEQRTPPFQPLACDTNPFLVGATSSLEIPTKLVDLRPQSLVTDPFATKATVDPFAAPGEDATASASGTHGQANLSLLHLQLDQSNRNESHFK